MKKLILSTQAEAQQLAWACHGFLASTNPSYAVDIQSQQTNAWCIPAEELDANDQPTGSWYIWVREDMSVVDLRIAALFPVETPV